MINKQIFKEGLILVGLAVLVGFAYTFFTKQGFFARNTSQNSTPPKSNLEMVSLAMVKDIYNSGNALFIDSRHEYDYKLGHIHGAINIPLNDFDKHRAHIDSIAKDKELIVYCDGEECNSSLELSAKLSETGFLNVKIFFGGWQEWKSAGLPIEK